jgi:hypothetical protein
MALLPALGVDAQIADAMAGPFVDLVEADLLGIGCSRNRTGNEGKAQEPLPIGAGCHEKLLTKQKLRIQNWSRRNRSNFQNERWPFASQPRDLFSFSSC